MEAVSRQHGDDLDKQRALAEAEWYRCKPWIVAAMKHNHTHDIEDIERALAEDRMQFWPGKNAAMVTQIITFPKLRYIDIFLCGGDLDELFEMEQAVCEIAKTRWGCQRASGGGRKGWVRALAHIGYKPVTVLEKDLTNG
jgi:hypothetical protein